MNGLTLFALAGMFGLPAVLTILKVPPRAVAPFAVFVFALAVGLDAIV